MKLSDFTISLILITILILTLSSCDSCESYEVTRRQHDKLEFEKWKIENDCLRTIQSLRDSLAKCQESKQDSL